MHALHLVNSGARISVSSSRRGVTTHQSSNCARPATAMNSMIAQISNCHMHSVDSSLYMHRWHRWYCMADLSSRISTYSGALSTQIQRLCASRRSTDFHGEWLHRDAPRCPYRKIPKTKALVPIQVIITDCKAPNCARCHDEVTILPDASGIATGFCCVHTS